MNTTDITIPDRLRGLAAATGQDALDLAGEELETYKAAVRELRAERDVLRARLVNYIVAH